MKVIELGSNGQSRTRDEQKCIYSTSHVKLIQRSETAQDLFAKQHSLKLPVSTQ